MWITFGRVLSVIAVLLFLDLTFVEIVAVSAGLLAIGELIHVSFVMLLGSSNSGHVAQD
jgi:hypothetical protein